MTKKNLKRNSHIHLMPTLPESVAIFVSKQRLNSSTTNFIVFSFLCNSEQILCGLVFKMVTYLSEVMKYMFVSNALWLVMLFIHVHFFISDTFYLPFIIWKCDREYNLCLCTNRKYKVMNSFWKFQMHIYF